MAYLTGAANNFADLLTAIKSAVTANGWTVSSNLISKGNCHVLFDIRTPSASAVTLCARAGISSAGGALTGTPSPQGVRIGSFDSGGTLNVTFPVTYHLHILTAPDEVYVIINYDVSKYQWLAFGCSPAAGSTGTGTWAAATFGCSPTGTSFTSNRTGGDRLYITPYGGGQGNNDSTSAGLFYNVFGTNSFGFTTDNSVMHSNIGTHSGWSAISTNMPNASEANGPLMAVSPNAWNQLSILHRIIPSSPFVGSSKRQVIGKIEHARYLKINNHEPGSIITLGSDRWKLYPFHEKGSAELNGYSANSGFYGHAIRYDGP